MMIDIAKSKLRTKQNNLSGMIPWDGSAVAAHDGNSHTGQRSANQISSAGIGLSAGMRGSYRVHGLIHRDLCDAIRYEKFAAAPRPLQHQVVRQRFPSNRHAGESGHRRGVTQHGQEGGRAGHVRCRVGAHTGGGVRADGLALREGDAALNGRGERFKKQSGNWVG